MNMSMMAPAGSKRKRNLGKMTRGCK